ncbi:MAG: hypothetical protein H6858_00840 [Rhodospirillales bacterium]|nr:hypothetical protein [Alphaproteobacteria bacterium]MCB1841185.1 hypothetical protein [Alphaproteobacteria bacterium]MCB9976126.1 hypothetical protein [Rhodospirillales bacterium]
MSRVTKKPLIALLGGLFLLSPMQAFAEDQGAGVPFNADKLIHKRMEEDKKSEDNEAESSPSVKQDPATLKKRVELAQEMHNIRPTSEQVESAIKRASQSVPLEERESFIAAMTSVLNYKAIERISVDAMAEVYTVDELQAMVDYYSKPEAKSASSVKSKKWSAVVNDEINSVIDKAMMRVRTGALQDKSAKNTEPGPDEAVSADELIKNRTTTDAEKKKDGTEAATSEKKDAVEEKQDPATLDQRMELAGKMHQIRPLNPQIDREIRRASTTVPLKDREAFIAAMTTVINYKAIEQVSIKTMAEVYTLPELKAMVDYYGKPEAKSATAKIGDWAKLVQPQISRIIDRAIMRVRTGAPN